MQVDIYCKKKRMQDFSCIRKCQYGGDKGDRTPDLLHAMQALSQLSYAPVLFALTRASITKSGHVVKTEFPLPVRRDRLWKNLLHRIPLLVHTAQNISPP